MIHKKCFTSPNSTQIVRYMFGAHIKDAEKRPKIEFIGGNILSKTPFGPNNSQNVRSVDTRAIEAEFDAKISLYHGSGEKLVEHHILSLPTQDEVDDAVFKKIVKDFLIEMGVDASMTWVAARHSDTDYCHVHIALCRVQQKYGSDGNPSYYGLLSDRNDFERGMEAVRIVEQRYGLTSVMSPGENENNRNQASIIRAIGKSVLSTELSNLSEFAHAMAKRGVEIKASLNTDGRIAGLSYRLNCYDGRWISGSTVMGTKMTYGALKKTLGYIPSRDDPTLGLGLLPKSPTVAVFRRAKQVSFGILAKIESLSPTAKKLFNAYPRLYLAKRGPNYLGGLKITLNLYPAAPDSGYSNRYLWADLVNLITRQMLKLLKNCLRDTNFQAYDITEDAGLATTLISVPDVSENRTPEILRNAMALFNEDRFKADLEILIAKITKEEPSVDSTAPLHIDTTPESGLRKSS